MRFKFISSAMFAAALGLGPAAFALDRDSSPSGSGSHAVQIEKMVTVPLSQGRPLNVHLAKMGDARMAAVTIDDLNSLLSRAEGHSMNIGN